MPKLTVHDIEVSGQEVLMRVDFNVPLKDGVITDDTRIEAAVPTIKLLLEKGAKLVLCSHLGRPKGAPEEKYSLKPTVARLSKLLGKSVGFVIDCIGADSEAARAALKSGEVLLLENVRFYAQEEKNAPDFAKSLAGNAEIFVNDAFGTAHRAHASTEGVTHFVKKSVMGLLIERELDYLEGKLQNPARPFIVILGGAKVSDKIQVIESLMQKADGFIIGGAMANTFLKAQGYELGKSLVEADKLDLANEILVKAKEKNVAFYLPADVRATEKFEEGAATQSLAPFERGGAVPTESMSIDIGDEAIAQFSEIIKSAGTILWNGPMGVFEIDAFAKGTKEIAKAVAESGAVTIVGGGDSVTAAKKFGFEEKLSFLSTGGGASLELLEGKELPGVAALTNK